MTDTAEIVARLRSQHIEVAGLAADAIERLSASEAEARQALAQMQEQCVKLLAQLGAANVEAPKQQVRTA